MSPIASTVALPDPLWARDLREPPAQARAPLRVCLTWEEHQRLRHATSRFGCSQQTLVGSLIRGIPIPAPPRRPATPGGLEEARELMAARRSLTQATALLVLQTRRCAQAGGLPSPDREGIRDLQQALSAVDQLIRDRLRPLPVRDV